MISGPQPLPLGPWTPALLLCWALAGLAFSPAQGAQPRAAPQQVVEQVSEGLRRVLREERRRLVEDPGFVHRLVDELFLPHLDFARTSALALGPHWARASPRQRAAFQRQFKALLVHTYATAVHELSDWEIEYLPLAPAPGEDDVIVPTRVRRPGGEPIAVDYRMHRVDGKWLAYDVSVAGVSLLASYRAAFVRIAAEKGVDGLITELAARNAARVPEAASEP